MQIVC